VRRVVSFHRAAGPEVLRVEDVDVPAPKDGEVQIRVKAMGPPDGEGARRAILALRDQVAPPTLTSKTRILELKASTSCPAQRGRCRRSTLGTSELPQGLPFNAA
jgi:NADPH:quinone reductase-like Zn-dependent oxidoreductase